MYMCIMSSIMTNLFFMAILRFLSMFKDDIP